MQYYIHQNGIHERAFVHKGSAFYRSNDHTVELRAPDNLDEDIIFTLPSQHEPYDNAFICSDGTNLISKHMSDITWYQMKTKIMNGVVENVGPKDANDEIYLNYVCGEVKDVLCHKTEKSVLYAVSSNGVWKTHNADAPLITYLASNWHNYNDINQKLQPIWHSILEESVTCITFDNNNHNTVYCGTTAGYYVSLDGGFIWTYRATPANLIIKIIIYSNNITIAASNGIHRSVDAGLNFSLANGISVGDNIIDLVSDGVNYFCAIANKGIYM